LIGALSCFGTAAEVLLAEESELGFEFGDASVEGVLALAGALMHGFPVADLLSQGEAFGWEGAVVTGGGVSAGAGLEGEQER
jgi:hypothetical protein